jgi:hypothetical protein
LVSQFHAGQLTAHHSPADTPTFGEGEADATGIEIETAS